MAPQIVVNFAKAAVPAAKPVIRSQGRRILSGAFDILKNLGKGGASKAKGFGSAVKQAVTPGPVTQFFGKAAGGALRATGPISAAAGLGTGATIVSMAALGGTSPEEVAKQSRVDLTKYGVGDKYEVEGYGRLQGVGSFLLNQGAKFSGQDPASYSEKAIGDLAAQNQRDDILRDTGIQRLTSSIQKQALAIEKLTGQSSDLLTTDDKGNRTASSEITQMQTGENKELFQKRLEDENTRQNQLLQLGRTGGDEGKKQLKMIGPNAESGEIADASNTAERKYKFGDEQTAQRNLDERRQERITNERRYKDEQSLLLQKLIADSNRDSNQFAIQMAQQNYQNRALDMRDERDARRDRQQMLMQIMKGLSNVGQALY